MGPRSRAGQPVVLKSAQTPQAGRFHRRSCFHHLAVLVLQNQQGQKTRREMLSEEVCPEVECARDSIAPATQAIRRKRGPSLSRRIGQRGNVFQHCKPWNPTVPAYGRFWFDVPGENRQRKSVSLGICRTPSVAKQKLREYIESTGVNSTESFTTHTTPATTFRSQATKWIARFPRGDVNLSNPPRFPA